MMDFLHTWLESCDMPMVTAFILGLLTALSPCPLATNITAIGFIGKDIANRNRMFLHGILYTLGRAVTYTVLGALLIYMIRRGIDTFALQSAISHWGEILMPPVLVAIGVLMLVGDRLPLRHLGVSLPECTGCQSGVLGSLSLGMAFALAFCPTSGLFYFGMLIPMSATAIGGYALPAVYALATGLPVVTVAWIIAYSVANIAVFYHKIRVFQYWLNILVAVLFITVGLYYAYTFYL